MRPRWSRQALRRERAVPRRARRPAGAGRLAPLLACALWLPAGAEAREIEGARFAERVVESGVPLELRGVGVLRYRWLFDVYVAALYADPDAPTEGPLGDVARRLEIEYRYGIGAEDFRRSTLHFVRRNVDGTAFQRLQPALAALNALYRDVAPGDRYALSYLPGRGTELALNGETLGRIEGTELAAAVFGIWLGPRPLDDGLKADLLGEP